MILFRYIQRSHLMTLLCLSCMVLSINGFAVGCETPITQEPGTEPTVASPEPTSDAKDAGGAPDATKDATKEAIPEPTKETLPEPAKEANIPDNLDLAMKAEDFGCILDWKKVNRYRITNKLGFLTEALAVANAKDGGVFPVGTVIQLVPQEAMVKRKKGWSDKTNDWEFFFLKVDKDGTTIVVRGTDQVKNQFGGNCLNCHSKAEKKWDLICAEGHGCDPLPLSPQLIENLQNSDPRCP